MSFFFLPAFLFADINSTIVNLVSHLKNKSNNKDEFRAALAPLASITHGSTTT